MIVRRHDRDIDTAESEICLPFQTGGVEARFAVFRFLVCCEDVEFVSVARSGCSRWEFVRFVFSERELVEYAFHGWRQREDAGFGLCGSVGGGRERNSSSTFGAVSISCVIVGHYCYVRPSL